MASITVLRSESAKGLAKHFGSDLTEPPTFIPGQHFAVERKEVSSISELSDFLLELQDDPSRCVIRGVPIDETTTSTRRTLGNIREVTASWCMIDIDELEWLGDPSDHLGMLTHAVSKLPKEFKGVDFHYQFSASMGIKEGIRVHLWFWLSRPCSDLEMKAWLAGYPVDLSLFNPIQIHLTANPLFVHADDEPKLVRSGFISGDDQSAQVEVPSNLMAQAKVIQGYSRQRHRGVSRALDPSTIIRDEVTGLVIDGREQLLFLLSTRAMRTLTTSSYTPTEDELTQEIWRLFNLDADLSVVSDRGPWTLEHARTKARDRLREHQTGSYSYVSRSDRVLLPTMIPPKRPELCSAT